jgi:hypothetical protein
MLPQLSGSSFNSCNPRLMDLIPGGRLAFEHLVACPLPRSPKQDIVEIWAPCVAFGTLAMNRVPPDSVARAQLLEVDDCQLETRFPGDPCSPLCILQ